MEKLKTNELSLGLNQTLRNDLVENFEKIQKGVDGQSDSLNKQILGMLGNVAPQDQNEVTQARIDANGKSYDTLKGREDATQATAETALSEERETLVEVQDARTNSTSQTYPTLKDRMDSQENDLNNNINDKLAQISATPETFANLAALQAKYPNGKVGIFVTVDNGHKYIWNNNQWQDAGVYQSVGISDGEALNIADTSLNINNFIVNGTFAGSLDGVNARNNVKLTRYQNTFGKTWVNVATGIDDPDIYQAIEFAMKPSIVPSLNDTNIVVLKFEFDLISNYDADFNLRLNFQNTNGSYIESSRTMNTLRITANKVYSFNFMTPKFLIEAPFKNAFVAISDPVAEKVNFSISNMRVTAGGI
ncbi:hypothetical protein [Leuconostoc pseudomesenteroides]|uniref:hypothetical protein n=1 Tax=Leuconostoc pseudomesenteroides TaxID=33968 RepID=UPI0039ECBFE7